MAENSKIEWTDATWNPITGCTLVDEGCRHCYAARLAATRMNSHPSRAGLARKNAAGEYKFTGEVRLNGQWLDQPLRWKKPRRIFVVAHGDLFHEKVPDEWIDRVFAVMALCPQHTFQVLTKRPERAREYLSALYSGQRRVADAAVQIRGSVIAAVLTKQAFKDGYANVWIGTSVSDQASADARIPELLATPAAVRFLSVEPMLGPIGLTCLDADGYNLNTLTGDMEVHGNVWPRVDLVICGGESGPHARPMRLEWARSLRDQCVAAGVPYFFKQWGEWGPLFEQSREAYDPSGPTFRAMDHPMAEAMVRVGKRAAGRLLDGRTWDEVPEVKRG